jgi:hypothetical protein
MAKSRGISREMSEIVKKMSLRTAWLECKLYEEDGSIAGLKIKWSHPNMFQIAITSQKLSETDHLGITCARRPLG